MMGRLVAGFFLALMTSLANAGSPSSIEMSATSSFQAGAVVDDNRTVHISNTIYIPFTQLGALFNEDLYLATVNSRLLYQTNREPGAPTGEITVSVDDLSGASPRHLVTFTDPGASGNIFKNKYFATTQPGCCDAPNEHHVRFLTTGKHLFESYGDGPMGISTWAGINFDPTIALKRGWKSVYQTRWAALKGPETDNLKSGAMATLVYGSDEGELSAVELFVDQSNVEEIDMYFRLTNADLLWNDVIERPISMENGQYVRGYGPINGTVYSPKVVWRSNETDDWSLGLQVVIAVNGDWLAVVPIERDQLRPEKAFFRRELSAIKLLR